MDLNFGGNFDIDVFFTAVYEFLQEIVEEFKKLFGIE